MRHRQDRRKLSRSASHRKALFMNLAREVIDHERIKTTEAKAKAVKPEIDKLITLAKRGDHHARRQAMAKLGQDKFVVYKLFEEIGPRYADREGGYTRILKLGPRQSAATDPDYAALKEGTKALWSLGDYSQIERFTHTASEALVEACAVSAGQEVLDLAAAEGASVVASDLTPHLIERGKERTGAAGVDIEWVEADAEELPFDDEQFDCTASVFGAMFAPRPRRTAEEMFRV